MMIQVLNQNNHIVFELNFVLDFFVFVCYNQQQKLNFGVIELNFLIRKGQIWPFKTSICG